MALIASVLLMAATLTAQDIEPAADEPEAPQVDETVEAPAPVVHLSPRQYLYATYSAAVKLDCMIQRESSWNPYARSGPYVGLAQFDYPTWMETPQGRQGLSRTDPYAAIDAMAWGVAHLGYQ